jgi:hypothetical protein
MLYAALSKTLELLAAGKVVAVASSTKGFTIAAQKAILRLLPDVRVRVYNSDSHADVSDVDREWVRYDTVIFSPTITAGVSCEVDHFDCLVAYFVNSPFTAGVDACLQMLWRVRNLKDGDMFVFLLDHRPDQALPTTLSAVRERLLEDVDFVRGICGERDVHISASTIVSTDRVRYDETRLSFAILTGIAAHLNRSLSRFAELFVNTLTEDYGVACTVEPLPHDPKFDFDLDIALCREVAAPGAPPPFEDVEILTLVQYEDIASSHDATLLERAAARLHRFTSMYGIAPGRVDEAFYLEFVMKSDADDTFYKAKRAITRATTPVAQSRARLAERMTGMIVFIEDANIDLRKDKGKDHGLKLILGQELLEDVCAHDPPALVDIGAFRPVKIDQFRIERGVQQFTRRLRGPNRDSQADWRALCRLFGVKSGMDGVSLFRSICQKAFGIKCKRGSENNERGSYKILYVTSEVYRNMRDTYAPALFI